MADKTEGSIRIAAGARRVMDVIADFEKYPEWSSAIKKVEVRDPGSAGRARDVYFEAAFGPFTATYTLRYEYEGDAAVSWKTIEATGIRSLEGEYALTPSGEGTDVAYSATMEIGIPVPGFIKRQGQRMATDTALKGLKKRVESLG